MKLFVTGGTGYTGSNFLSAFLSDDVNNEAIVLVRPSSNRNFLPTGYDARMQIVIGDISDVDTFSLMVGCDAIMHIGSRFLCEKVVVLAQRAGISRVFFVTTTGVFSKFNDLSAGYKATEDVIRSSGLNWTILRPTLIFGGERDLTMHKLLLAIDKYVLFPVFGDGTALMQPVYVNDLAQGLLLALKNEDKTSLKEYNLPGSTTLSYNQMVETAAKELGRQIKLVHIPLSLSLFLANIAEMVLGKRSPIKSEQVRRLTEDKSCSFTEAHADFNYEPGAFSERIAREVTQIRLVGLLQERSKGD